MLWLASLLLNAASVTGTVKEAGTRVALPNVDVVLTDMAGVHET